MPFQTRRAEHPKDSDRMDAVWSWVYDLQPPAEALDAPAPGEIWFLGEADGEPATACKVHDYRVARGIADLSCGGVGAVATLSQHRQKGYGTQFMLDLLPVMREAGHVVSSLYAFRDPFYANVGYATCGWRWSITCPTHRLPKTDCDLPVRQIDAGDVSKLDDAYERFVRTFSGSIVRRGHEWKNRLGRKPPLIYAVGDPIEGYAWVKMSEFWGNVDAGEVVWSTSRAYAAVLSVLRGVAHNQSTVTWSEPPNSPYLAAHYDQGVQMRMARPTMHRVLDVPAAIRALKPQDKGEFTMQVVDPQMPQNLGPWRVAYSPNGTEVARADSAQIELSIGSFSQALMGAPSLAELAQHGKLRAQSETAIQSAQRLLTPMPVCCMEFF